MEQTFADLCRERERAGKGVFSLALWMFAETIVGIMRESVMHTTGIVRIAVATACILSVPLIAGWPWDLADFIVAGALLFGAGSVYELIGKRYEVTTYRAAFGVGLVTAFVLAWVNGAVGIIGNERQPANLLYAVVFVVGLVGSLVARFRPLGMARTLFAAAVVQMSIPVIAVIVWPGIFWGGAGPAGVFVLNASFAAMFVASGLLFRRAARRQPPSAARLAG